MTAYADNRKRSIGIKVSTIARQLRRRFDERVEKMGVTRAKWMLIAAVARNPGATQRMIAADLEVTDVTAGRLIDRICTDGLLERRENPQDRRAYCMYLTAAAQPVMDKIAKAAEQYETEVFASFDEEDLRRLDDLLGRMARNLNNPEMDAWDRKPSTPAERLGGKAPQAVS